MIELVELKPKFQQPLKCLHCAEKLEPESIVWQGMHTFAKYRCGRCQHSFFDELKVGHATHTPYLISENDWKIYGREAALSYWGNPTLHALQNPRQEEIAISKEVFQQCQEVVIVNTVDFLYGDCLLKLLTIEKHLSEHPNYGVVVIVQKFLRWMVPKGVAEIWTVDIPLRSGQHYYPAFQDFVNQELNRFEKVFLSKTYLRADPFDITRFTQVPKHQFDFENQDYQITFVWREDRLWWGNFFWVKVLTKLRLLWLPIWIQNLKVRTLFRNMQKQHPQAQFAVVGLGTTSRFPDWIKDYRVSRLDDRGNRELCQICAESRLVIGMQGSAMLKPSGHAGLTIVLTPVERWENLGHDILFQEPDPRLSFYRYQYFPASTRVGEMAVIASNMVERYTEFHSMLTKQSLL